MATYDDKIKDLSSLSPDELRALEGEITSEFEAADESDDLDAMSAAADALDAVRAAMKDAPEGEPEAAVEDESEDAYVASAATESTESEGEATAESEDNEDEATAESDQPEGDAPASTDDEAKEADVDIPKDREPVATGATTVITAGADIPNLQHGTRFTSKEQVADAFVARLNTFRGVRGGDGEQLIVATVASAAPAERTLSQNDIEGNRQKIEALTAQEAIVASGGYCAPLEVKYDLFGLGIADRPVRDALAGFQASRGGIRYTQPPVLSDLAAAVGVWTAANDANPTAPTEKPCLKVECSPEQTAMVDAVTMCLEIGNLQARAYPELVTRNNDLAMIQHARLADLTLLNKISALSTAVTAQFRLGVARDFLEAVGRGAAAYRHRHRMGDDTYLRVLAPAWVRDAIREDLTWGLPGDQLEWADSVINGFFSTRRVNISWHLDDASSIGGPQAVGVLNAWPTTFKWQIFAEGTFLFLDGGTLDLGIVRDGQLVSTNDYKMFVETFEGLAKVGIESIEVTSQLDVTGHVSSTAAPAADLP